MADVLVNVLKEMFKEVVEAKQASKIPDYYHPDFLLYTNGKEMNYTAFLEGHEEIYSTSIEYSVEYDEEAFVEEDERLAARLYITIRKEGKPPHRLEIILIAHYIDLKLYRLWELTYPSWSQLSTFEGHFKDT